MDAIAYESVLVGLFSIFSGKAYISAKCGGNTTCNIDGAEIDADAWQGSEQNALHLGFSRDSFYFSRPPPLVKDTPRTPFIPENEGPHCKGRLWCYGNVQSVAGGFVTNETHLRFYFSARSSNVWGNTTAYTGTATLRRDGFASMVAAERASNLTTRLLRFTNFSDDDKLRDGLFVNVNASTSGFRVWMLSADGTVVLGASKSLRAVDSTKLKVLWVDAPSSK